MSPSPRLQIASLTAGYVVAGLFWGMLAAAMPAFQAQAQLGDAGFGLALGLMALAAMPVMRMVGRYLHRIEALAIPLSMTMFSLATLVLVAVPGLWGVLLGFILTGAASGALDISLNNRTARIEQDTGVRLFNRMHAAFPLSMLTASAVTGALRDRGVSPDILLIAVTLALLLGAGIEYRAGRHVAHGRSADDPVPGRARLTGPLIVLALMAASAAFQEAASNGWVAIYVENILSGGPLAAGLAPAAYVLGLAVGRIIAHMVEARITAMQTVRLAAFVALPAFALIAAGPAIPLTIALCFLAGCGVGPIEPAVFRATAHQAEAAGRGPALAAVTTITYMGYLLSPPALGLVAEYLGWPALWGSAAALSGVVVYLTTRLPRMAG